ncbi:hypothetical protein OHA46_33870 (plasmid) [Streptomyces sp. NBC_00708]
MMTTRRAYGPLMALIGAVVGSALTLAGAVLVMPAKGERGDPGPQGAVGAQGQPGPAGNLSGLSGTTVLTQSSTCPQGMNSLSPIVYMKDNYGDTQMFHTCIIR